MPYQLDQIDPTKTVMIVVDMQNDFVAEGAKLRSAMAAAMVPKLASTLKLCRKRGIRIIYTAHVHRRDGSDMGLYDDLYPPIADHSTLVDGTPGVDIFSGLAPAPGEHVIKKHRDSAFFELTSILFFANGGSPQSSFPGRPPKTAAMPQRGTQCFITTRSSSFPTRPERLTIPMLATAPCWRKRRLIKPRYASSRSRPLT